MAEGVLTLGVGTREAGRGLCPECGTAVDAALGAVRGKALRGVRWWPRVGVLAVVLLLVLGAVFKQEHWKGVARSASRWETGAGHVTLGELQELAEGRGDGTELVANLAEFSGSPSIDGNEDVVVRVVAAAGYRIEGTIYGWPTQIASQASYANYENAFAKTGPIAKDWGYSSCEFWNNRGGNTSGAAPTLVDRHWSLWSGPVSLVICYLLAGWYGGACAAWMVGRVRRRPVRHRLAVAVAGASVALGAVVVGTLATADPIDVVRLDPWVYPAGALTMSPAEIKTQWTMKDLRAAIVREDAARAIALKFAAAFPATRESDLYVDVGYSVVLSPHTSEAAGFPSGWLLWGECQQDGWPGVFHRPGWRINEHRIGQVEHASLDGATVRYWAVDGPALANYVLMAWLLWHVPRLMGGLIEGKVARRRRARGLCVCCGYDLAGLRGGAGGSAAGSLPLS